MAGVTITEFLLARLNEDDEKYRHGCEGDGEYSMVADLADRYDATRVAMLRIVTRAATLRERKPVDESGFVNFALHQVLQDFAAIWSDHPDYDEEWRP